MIRKPRTPNTTSILLTVDEVAQELRLHSVSVYELIERGELPGVIRYGRAIRISREALLGYIRSQTVGVTGRLEA